MGNDISRNFDNEYKKAIAQFRVNSQKLVIGNDRHGKPIIQMNCRFFKYRRQGSIDGEQNFLVDCHFNGDDRYSLFEDVKLYKYLDGNNSRDKFIYIMKYKEIPTSNALGKKIHNYFQKRESSQACIISSEMATYLLCMCVCVCVSTSVRMGRSLPCSTKEEHQVGSYVLYFSTAYNLPFHINYFIFVFNANVYPVSILYFVCVIFNFMGHMGLDTDSKMSIKFYLFSFLLTYLLCHFVQYRNLIVRLGYWHGKMSQNTCNTSQRRQMTPQASRFHCLVTVC